MHRLTLLLATSKRVLIRGLLFLIVGPLAGTVVYLVLMTIADPRGAARDLNVLPLVVFAAYFAGAIPAGLTGAATALLDLRGSRDYVVSIVVGAAVTSVAMHMLLEGSFGAQGVFWRFPEAAWLASLQNAIWGGLSAWLTAYVVADGRAILRKLCLAIESAGGWHLPPGRR